MSHGRHITFTTDDLRTIDRLERTLRQFESAINSMPASFPKIPDTRSLVATLAPLIRQQLQANGIAPLNLESLLPAITGSGVLLEDTHANRVALYPAANWGVGTLFFETDRTVLYVITQSGGTNVWSYIAGVMQSTFANRPTDLTTTDVNFSLFVTTGTAGVTYNHSCIWTGAAWIIVGDQPGIFVESAVALAATTGHHPCDGTATTYLAISGANLVETAFTTPDENTAPSGVFHTSIAAYTGVINAASAPTISGSVANTTATNQATTANNQSATTGVTVDAHDVIERLDDAGAGIWVFDAEADAGHTVVDPGHDHTQDAHNHTQDAHTHAVGTLAVSATGLPRNLGVLRYFRR